MSEIDLLREVADEQLFKTFAALTHQMHECKGSIVAGKCDGPCRLLREQRDLLQAVMTRRMEVGPKIVGLWNELNGWIPGAAYERLAEVLDVPVDMLVHWDPKKKERHQP
jgi:hypothetical protein